MAKMKRRADGLYQISIMVGRKPDGGTIRKVIYGKTQAEVQEKEQAYRQQLKEGALATNERMTFGECAKIWFDNYKPNVSPNTRRMYQSSLRNHLMPVLGGYRLRELKPLHLQSILNQMATNSYATKTIREVKNTANQIMELAMDNDMLSRNVFRKVTLPKGTKSERRALTQKEQQLLLSTCGKHRMGIPALLMMLCGLRRGELMALTWNDVNFDEKTLRINKAVQIDGNKTSIKPPKSEAGNRTVPIPNVLVESLQEAKRYAQTVLICPSASNQMMTQEAFRRAWQSYQHALNISAGGRDGSRSRPKLTVIDNITPHMLRHTYATLLFDAGVDVKTAQRYLGHADVVTTLRIYTHLSEQKQKASDEALNRWFDRHIAVGQKPQSQENREAE